MAQQQQENQGSDDMIIVFVIIAIFAIAWFMWDTLYYEFSLPLIYLKAYEIKFFGLFVDLKTYGVTRDVWDLFIALGQNPDRISADSFVRVVLESDISKISKERIEIIDIGISQVSGRFIRWPFTAFVLLATVFTLFKMRGTGFKRVFSLAGGYGSSFAMEQAKHWQVTSPGVYFNPDKLEKNSLPAMTPLEWLKENKISLQVNTGLDEEKANKAFIKQLGRPWKGVRKANIYVKAFCVLCALSAARHKETRGYKEELALIWTKEMPSNKKKSPKKRTQVLIAKYMKNRVFVAKIDEICSQHYYTNTAMFRILEWARVQGGVLASAEVLWIKPINRNLWYVLNNVGRRAFHIEASGSISHYFAERVIRKPVPDPYVKEAIKGLNIYLEEHNIQDLERFFEENKKQDEWI